jgi:hypothetical protein
MAKAYQPLIQDKDRSIRKNIDKIYKKIRWNKSRIAEMAMKRGLVDFLEEVPEISEESK